MVLSACVQSPHKTGELLEHSTDSAKLAALRAHPPSAHHPSPHPDLYHPQPPPTPCQPRPNYTSSSINCLMTHRTLLGGCR